MMKRPVTGVWFVCLIVAFAVNGQLANGQALEEQSAEQAIASRLAKADPSLPIESVAASPADGLYEVTLTNGLTLFTTADGAFFVLGDLFAVGLEGIANLSEERRSSERAVLLADVPESDMVIFAPDGEVRATVTVFTDVDCFYCRKFHGDVPALNDMGVRVRYLAWPRSGVGGDSYRKIASAWCSDNPQDALTQLKRERSVPDNVCPGNPVADQMALGSELGVQGTPSIVFENGSMLGGYVPIQALAARLGLD